MSTRPTSLPYTFEVKDTGIFYCKNGQLPVWVCARLKIPALTRDPNNENWGRVLEFKDADQQSHQWIMPDALLKGNGEQVIGELLRLGLNVHPGQKERKYLLEYISSINITERVRCVHTIGWYKESFVLPHKVYNQPEETIIYQSDYTLHTNETRRARSAKSRSPRKACVDGRSRKRITPSSRFEGGTARSLEWASACRTQDVAA